MALLQCQGEPECSYALQPVRRGVRAGAGAARRERRAGAAAAAAFPASPPPFFALALPGFTASRPSFSSTTRRGPALEDCDCAQDENCKSTKRAIEPCLPRTSGGGAGGPGAGAGGVLGCTEARRRCDRDSRCNLALSRYLTYCGKLFNGLRCTDECRTVIEDMLAMPAAALLNDWRATAWNGPSASRSRKTWLACASAPNWAMARQQRLGRGPGRLLRRGEYDDEQRTGDGGEQPLDDDDGVPHPPRPGGGAAAAGGRGTCPTGPGAGAAAAAAAARHPRSA